MLPRHLAYQIRRDLGGICEGLSKHFRKLRNNSPRICFCNIKLCMLCSKMLCDLLGIGGFIISLFIHANGKALHLSLIQILHQRHDRTGVNTC